MIEIEKRNFERIVGGITSRIKSITQDFDTANELRPFWGSYPPKQRGRKPSGDSVPWGEVGEKVLEGHFYHMLPSMFDSIRYVGLPFGHDIRFVTDEAFIHIDVKSTGPNDDLDEVVASPNQVTGDAAVMDAGTIFNTRQVVVGKQAQMEFQPELPPFYVINEKVLPCITMYLKIAYGVDGTRQPLKYVEAVCVPSGLLLFAGPEYAHRIPQLLIPGKDDKTVETKRTRIRLNPLSQLRPWACIQISNEGTWPRNSNITVFDDYLDVPLPPRFIITKPHTATTYPLTGLFEE